MGGCGRPGSSAEAPRGGRTGASRRLTTSFGRPYSGVRGVGGEVVQRAGARAMGPAGKQAGMRNTLERPGGAKDPDAVRSPGLPRRVAADVRRQIDAAADELSDHPAVHRPLKGLAACAGDPSAAGRALARLARELQEGLLPRRLPKAEGIRVAARLVRASADGGTGAVLYDVFEMSEGRMGFFVAEARCGGITAAPLLSMTKVLLDSTRNEFHSPLAILNQINAELVHGRPNGRCLAAFLGVLDLRTLHLRYVNASQRPPLRFGLHAPKALDGRGRFLGRFADPGYEEVEVQLLPGERVLFYTGGLVAAKGRGERPYTAVRLRRRLMEWKAEPPARLLSRLIGDLKGHLGGRKVARDIALVAAALAPNLVLDTKIVVRSEPSQLVRPVNAVMERLKALHYDERTQFAVRLCLEEALINALKHGNRMDRTKHITCTFRADEEGVRASVEDEGDGFHPDAVPDPTLPENLEVSHGRGLLLMRSYMDRVEFSNRGRKVTLYKKAPWA